MRLVPPQISGVTYTVAAPGGTGWTFPPTQIVLELREWESIVENFQFFQIFIKIFLKTFKFFFKTFKIFNLIS